MTFNPGSGLALCTDVHSAYPRALCPAFWLEEISLAQNGGPGQSGPDGCHGGFLVLGGDWRG